MCGILGLVGRDIGERRGAFAIAIDLLARRGPDDRGIWEGPGVLLGHRRLAVIDPSASARQPMATPDGRYFIVFNGEIYNFAEIREQLSPNESDWRTHSDTEVVLAAYRRWGASCLEHFRGMFAFAIWDAQDRSLFAARDRLGVKPFYYAETDGMFAFASRPRALLAVEPRLGDSVDEQALRYYLEIGYIPAPFAINRSVRKLAPAHYLLFRNGRVTTQRYWDFRHIQPVGGRYSRGSESELIEELDELVSQSVRLRLVSDVPFGAFLSGGIDSSLVVAHMARHCSARVKTFTIGFAEKEFDESAHAKAVADYLGTDHQCEILNVNDLIDLVPKFVEEYDEPFFDGSAFPTMAVSRLARSKVTVSLSGDGGDELFAGYDYYRIARGLEPFFRLPGKARKFLGSMIAALPRHRLKLLGAALREDSTSAAFAFSRSIAKDFHGVLPEQVLARTESIKSLFAHAAGAFPPGLSAAEQGMRLDILFTLPDDYLQKLDVASMAFSLEAREPLLDHKLVEWAMRLPTEMKLRGLTTKYLLRRLAYRYVPRQILDRPKRGFGVPVAQWLRGPLLEWARDLLHSAALYERYPLIRERVTSLLSLHASGVRDAHPLIWAILMLASSSQGSGPSGSTASPTAA